MAKAKKASTASGSKPTIASCIEAVLSNSDGLIQAVVDGLSSSTERVTNTMGNQVIQNPALLGAINVLVVNREAVTQKFTKRLRALLYAGLGTAGQVRNVTSFQELRLFEEDQLDDSIEIARAQQEMSMAVEKTLPQLDALISGLLGWITVQSQINPLRPEIFIHALRDALKEFVPDDEVRGQLITPAAGRLGVALERLYRKVCDWLLMHGVEAAGPTLSINAGAAGAASAGAVSSTVAKTMLTLDKLRRLLTGENNEQLPSDALGKRGSGFLHTVPLSLKAIEDGNMMESMVERLDRQAQDNPQELARRQEEARQALQGGKNIGKLLGEEVTRVMLDNLLKDDRLLPKVRILLKALEPALVDLAESDVRFFNDEDQPARQYLSMISDRAVGFAHEQDEGFPRFFKSIQDAVSEVVNNHAHLANKGETTVVFALALQNLLAVWERTDAIVRAQQEAAARALLLAEQRNMEAQRLALEFHEQLDVVKVPDAVRDFLTGVWSQVVAKAVVESQDEQPDSRGYQALVSELIWSAQPKVARKDRPRLLALIPGLLTKLRLGVKSIEYPNERLLVFFDELLRVHEQALEGRPPKQQEALYKPEIEGDEEAAALEQLTGTDAPPSSSHQSMYGPGDSRWGQAVEVHENAGATASAFIDFEHEEAKLRHLVGESAKGGGAPEPVGADDEGKHERDHKQPETLEKTEEGGQKKEEQEREPAVEAEAASAPLQLQVGAWVEMQIKGRWTRAQLTWQSPRKTMYVFVTGSGTAHSLSSRSLETLQTQGQLRLVAEGRVLDQALNAVASAALQNSAQNPR